MNAIVSQLLERCRAAGVSLVVEGDALHVDFEGEPPLDLVEELRPHKAKLIAAMASSAGVVIAPARWVERAVAGGETPFERSCPERRGVVERRSGGMFVHFCVQCGRWGAYGYDCSSTNPGRWYCREHHNDRFPG